MPSTATWPARRDARDRDGGAARGAARRARSGSGRREVVAPGRRQLVDRSHAPLGPHGLWPAATAPWCGTATRRHRRRSPPARSARRARPRRARRRAGARAAPRRGCRSWRCGRRPARRRGTRAPWPAERSTRACRPDTATRSTSSGDRPAPLRASVNAASTSGRYTSSPKRSSHCRDDCSPGVRQRSRNSALVAACPTSSATTPSSPNTSATAPSPPSRSSADPARPVRRSESTAIVRPPDADIAAAARTAPTLERTEPARSYAPAHSGSSERGVDRRGVGLVDVGRRGCGEQQRRRTVAVERGQRPPRRLDAHRGRVLVEGGDGACAATGRSAERRADGAPLQPPVRQVDAPRHDPDAHDDPVPLALGGASNRA